jgi:hypothetical protein
MPIFVKASASQSRAAIANVVYNDSKYEYGYITAAHIFSPWGQDTCSIDSGEDDIGIPFDSDSDDEDCRNEQMSSTRNSTPLSVKSSRSQDTGDENALLHAPTRQTFPGEVDSPSDLALLGHITTVEDLEKSTDCAIITIEDPELHQKLENLTVSKRDQNIRIASAKFKSSLVTAWTTHGPIRGILNSVPILMRFPGGDSFHSVYAFSYEGAIEDGDSGSLVVDSSSRELYGMVIAASDKQRIAYIVGTNGFLNHMSGKGWRLLQLDEDFIAATERRDELLRNDSQSTPTPQTAVLEQNDPQWSDELQRYLHICWDSTYARYLRIHYVEGLWSSLNVSIS